MRKSFPFASMSLAAVFGAAFLISVAGSTAGEGDKAPGSDIAVIHMDGVLVKYAKYQKRDEEITAYQQKLAAELKTKERELEDRKRKRDACAGGSKEWWDYDKQYQKAAAELDSRTKEAQAEIHKLDNELFMAILGDVESEIREYCKEHSIKIVLWKREVVLDQPTAAQRAMALKQISVLYADREIDITEEITEALNKKYKKESRE